MMHGNIGAFRSLSYSRGNVAVSGRHLLPLQTCRHPSTLPPTPKLCEFSADSTAKHEQLRCNFPTHRCICEKMMDTLWLTALTWWAIVWSRSITFASSLSYFAYCNENFFGKAGSKFMEGNLIWIHLVLKRWKYKNKEKSWTRKPRIDFI